MAKSLLAMLFCVALGAADNAPLTSSATAAVTTMITLIEDEKFDELLRNHSSVASLKQLQEPRIFKAVLQSMPAQAPALLTKLRKSASASWVVQAMTAEAKDDAGISVLELHFDQGQWRMGKP